MKPSVGRIVHVADHEGRCLAAIVTTVLTEGELLEKEPIGAVVFNPNGTFAPATGWRIFRGDPGQSHLWHWPERVES